MPAEDPVHFWNNFVEQFREATAFWNGDECVRIVFGFVGDVFHEEECQDVVFVL